MVPYNKKIPSIVYNGVEDEEGDIGWHLLKDNKVVNLKLGFDLHNDIKLYFVSYYFMELAGEIIDGLEVIMTPMTPLCQSCGYCCL